MWKKLLKELNLSDSYVSMGLGLLVVLVIGVLLFNYFSGKSAPSISETGEQTSEEIALNKELPTTHTVTNGETLWSIAQDYYQSGYNWTDIAKANNLTDASLIEEGQSLSIPVVTPIVTVTPVPADNTQITSAEETQPTATNIPESYTVVAGDTLWDIAVKVYNNGYRWSEIATLNNLANPDLIHSGNVLTLPR